MTLEFHAGYVKALADLAGWINGPNHLDRRLCIPGRLWNVINYIIDHVDEFMDCPDVFTFEFEIDKKGRLMIL